jgi:hypothetical protein
MLRWKHGFKLHNAYKLIVLENLKKKQKESETTQQVGCSEKKCAISACTFIKTYNWISLPSGVHWIKFVNASLCRRENREKP